MNKKKDTTYKPSAILVVEDNAGLRRLIQKKLESAGFSTAGFSKGADTINFVKKNPDTLLLLDYKLPDMTADKVIERLVEQNYEVPFIIMTGHGDEKIAVEMMKTGARDYLVKDANFLDLLPAVVNQVMNELLTRKRLEDAEEALKESEKLHDSILNTIPDIIYRLDLDGNITFISNAVKNYGYSSGELIGTNILELVHPEDREKAVYGINEKRTGDRSTKLLEVRLLTSNHVTATSKVKSRGIENEPVFLISAEGLYTSTKPKTRTLIGVQGIARDITKRKKAEEALRKSENRYKLLINAITSYVYTVTVENGKPAKTSHGPRCVDVTGYTSEEFEADPYLWFNMVHEKDREQVRDQAERVLSGEGDPPLEHRIIRKDGTLRWVRNVPVPHYDTGGKLIAYDGIIEDITERKQMEEALQRSEAKYRDLVETSYDLIWQINTDGRFIYLNPAWKNTLGYGIDEMLGRKFSDFQKPDIAEQHRKFFQENFISQKQIRLGRKGKKFINYETRLMSKSGEEVYLVANAIPMCDAAGNIIGRQGTAMDITSRKKADEEKRKLEKQLFQAQKMESIGRLAGGIAHDFNNILTGIMGYAELLKNRFNDTSTNDGRAADVIFNGAERAANLTKQLLGFAQEGKYNLVPLNINDVIKDSLKVAEKIFEKKIKVTLNFEKHINKVEADKNQLDQVLMNLLINAKDAMPSGGEIHIKTETVCFDTRYTEKVPELEPGCYVKISVTDTGTGMPKEVQERIFDPFFTTKGSGKGTGLGLATVYGIIKNHKGHINVCSEIGAGTTFTICLPVSEKEIVEKEEDITVITGDERILIVDDEAIIRNLAKEMLEMLEYKVLLAENGIEAVKIYREKKDEIDLVLLDMIMPDMAGRETFFELKKINPDVKAILLSGFSQDDKANEILNEGVQGFIPKPFKMHELSRIIAGVLKNSPNG